MIKYKLSRNDSVLVSTMPNGEKMMLDIDQGKYFALNGIGSLIWDELTEPRTVNELVEIFTARSDADRNTVESDINEFIEQMKTKKLLLAAE
ncbi:MAG: PqqD family protein [Bacillota bacterium]